MPSFIPDTDLGQLKYFFSVDVARSKKGFFLSQRKYVLDLLVEIEKLGAKTCGTLMVPNVYLTKDYGDPFDDLKRYKRLVGTLKNLMVTCLDIAYAVSIVRINSQALGSLDLVLF